MNREEAEKVLNAIDFKNGDNIVILNKKVYDKMENEKQELISWLGDKIKECDDNINLFLKKNNRSMFNGIEIAHLQDFKKIFQEVLDFVNGSGKDEVN